MYSAITLNLAQEDPKISKNYNFYQPIVKDKQALPLYFHLTETEFQDKI